MNVDEYRHFDTQDLSQERLDDSLFRFADALSGAKWDTKEAHEVGMSRSASEYIGEELPSGEDEVSPITMQTKLSFKADKTGGIAGDVDFGSPRYVLKSVVEQDIYLKDLPANVLEETLEDVTEKGHPLRKVLKEFGATSEPDDILETLGILSLVRRAKSKFVIADGGEIVRHVVSHRYAYEDIVFLSADYASDSGSMDWRRLERPEGFATELRPVVLEYISEDERTREDEIRRQAEGLDTELERYFFEKSLTEILRDQGRPAESTVRQVLGMLAMISADMKHYKP